MHYAIFGWNVAICDDKRKLRRFLRKRGWQKTEVQFGWVNRQTFTDCQRYKAEFGLCVIYDLVQGIKFDPDFNVLPSYIPF